MKKINKEKKKGFTLVEMLAVVVILALLVGIATPIISRLIENSKKKTFLSSFDTIKTNVMADVMLDSAIKCNDEKDDKCSEDYQYSDATLKVREVVDSAATPDDYQIKAPAGTTNCVKGNYVLDFKSSSVKIKRGDCPIEGACGTGGADEEVDNIQVCIKKDGKVTKFD